MGSHQGYNIPIYRRRRLIGEAPFSPASLFAAGEPGAWYDPSDMTTLFQNSAGTTPVTAVEQPVGLMLDKSKGLVLGPELFSSFNTITPPWVDNGGATYSIDGSQIANRDLAISPFYTTGKFYQTQFTLSGVTGGTITVFPSDGTTPFVVGNGTHSTKRYASQVYLIFRAGAGVTATVSGVSVRELAGNHAFQSTSASRPVLSARYNLLTKTEAFDDAVWVITGATAANTTATTDPIGGNTADAVFETTSSSAHSLTQSNAVSFSSGVTYTQSVYAKYAGRVLQIVAPSAVLADSFANFDLQNGVVGNLGGVGLTASITLIGNGWYFCSITYTSSANVSGGSSTPTFALVTLPTSVRLQSYTGDGTSGIYIWGAALRVSNDGVGLPAYQRVNTSTDYDTTGFPMYLRFDGVDDGMVTNTITPGVDKAQVFAGVRKLSSASNQMAFEFSPSGTEAGGLYVLFIGSLDRFQSRGTMSGNADSAVGSLSPPITRVYSGIGEISTDTSIIRINGSQAGSSVSDQGTGNYLSHPLYIGSRGGSLRLNGRLYPLIVRFGPNLTETQITNTETWVNGKTKAFAS